MAAFSRSPTVVNCDCCFIERWNRLDTAVASTKLWDELLFIAEVRNPELSIVPPNKLALSLDFSHSGSWNIRPNAVLDRPTIFWVSQPKEDNQVLQSGIALPNSYSKSFFKSTSISCSVTVVEPVQITEVIIIALSPLAFQLAQQRPNEVEQWLCRDNRLLRTGGKHSCRVLDGLLVDAMEGHSEPLYAFEVAMLEPVAQGVAQAGSSRFLVTLGSHKSEEYGSTPHSLHSATQGDVDDELVIDEYFLAGSTLRTGGSISRNTPSINGTQSNGVNTPRSLSPDHHNRIAEGIKLPAVTLTRKLNGNQDCSSAVYVRTGALTKLGVFEGDWVIAEAAQSRLLQIFTADEIADNPEVCFASPSLIRNLFPAHSKDSIMRLKASPFGAGPPSVPTAKTATLARIASPASLDRVHQKAFLGALKKYFAEKKRLVKKGDIIPVAISTGSVFDVLEAEEGKEDHDTVVEDSGHDQLLPDTAIFFLVTNLEYDIVSHSEERTLSDSFSQSAMGELGCWIDTSLTRMVQTGLEHSLVPDVSSYLSLDVWDSISRSEVAMQNKTFRRLQEFVQASLGDNAVDFGLQLSVLISGALGAGLTEIASQVARSAGFHCLTANVYDLIAETEAKTGTYVKDQFSTAASCTPCLLVLENVEAFAQTTQASDVNKEPPIVSVLQECIGDLTHAWKRTTFPVILVATSSQVERIPTGILTCFKQEIVCDVPDEKERQGILLASLSNDFLGADVSVKSLATQTAAFTAKDILDLVSRTRLSAVARAMKTIEGTANSAEDLFQAGILLTKADFDAGLEKARASFSQSIGAPTIPNVTWDDVGGLANVKDDILDTIQLPLDHPELFADGLKQRSGVLLYGPPGTGKTLLAKAVATSCSLNFFSVKGPELLNMYIGESEANVRRVFQRARDASPCVIFFDELDSVAPKRGNHGDSGGVMDRIVSQLLAELDGMSAGGSGSSVFVIGATNRPDLLDPALLRPGRFDRLLYLGISETHDAQRKIIEALTRKFRLDPKLDLNDVAERCPFNYTGADFYALCSDAMLKAMSRKAEEVDAKIARLNAMPPLPGHQYPLTPQYYLSELAEPSDTDVLVGFKDFELALQELVPSVSQSELDHYKAVQQRFTSNTSKKKGKARAE